ncbi:MAG TPA: DMT family transporter [Phototrophicaceae bacterium]|nr:DMT family transporter [Phototrophicaceae bacterium]
MARSNVRGIATAFMTPLFLGMAPIFGKLAINAGADPFTVAAWRTVIAVIFLWGMYALFARRYIYIYPAGLLGCVVIGTVNGIGSLFYYSGLGLLDASLSQLLNGMYLIFVVLLSRIGGERLDRRLTLRVLIALLALLILTGFGSKPVNWLGVGLMLANALMFAGTVILSQYVLYEMPAPTVTLYTVSTMGVLVTMVWIAVGKPLTPQTLEVALPPIIILGLTTALSRISLFSGVKLLGSLQTAILALAEIGVALALAFFILGDRLTPPQVIGVGILTAGILMIRPRDMLPHGVNPTRILSDLADLQFMWIAFDQAFGKRPPETPIADDTDPSPTAPKLTTMEITAIRKMMGVQKGPIDPMPLTNNSKNTGKKEDKPGS